MVSVLILNMCICNSTLVTQGALGSWGAALLEPYSDKPDTSGIMRSSPEALEDLVQKFWSDGWSTVSTLVSYTFPLNLTR